MTSTDVQLTTAPTTVADAVDVYARLGALSDWIDDRKTAVRGWVEANATARLVEDGAAPTWRVDGGTALLTDPAPRPSIADPEAFGRWYVTTVAGEDPDVIGRVASFADDRVRRTVVASVASDAMLDFLDDYAYAALSASSSQVAGVARALADRVKVTETWYVGEALLADLIAGKTDAVEGRPRVAVSRDHLVAIDTQTGEAVPGVKVAAPTARSVQIRPSAATKKAVKADLLGILGAAAIETK